MTGTRVVGWFFVVVVVVVVVVIVVLVVVGQLEKLRGQQLATPPTTTVAARAITIAITTSGSRQGGPSVLFLRMLLVALSVFGDGLAVDGLERVTHFRDTQLDAVVVVIHNRLDQAGSGIVANDLERSQR